jgi:hypothetical protein
LPAIIPNASANGNPTVLLEVYFIETKLINNNNKLFIITDIFSAY